MVKYGILLGGLLLASCSGNAPVQKVKIEKEVILEGGLFQPIYLGEILEEPTEFGPIWDLNSCKALNLAKISMYLKGGYTPDRIAEKYTYTFNSEGLPADFAHYQYSASSDPVSNLSFAYNTQGLSRIDITKYLNFTNLPPVIVQKDSLQTLVITSKGDAVSDSLIFYPSIEQPRIIVDIVNNFVNSIELFAEVGTDRENLMNMAMGIDSALVSFELAEKTVTFMKDGLPVESYRLNQQWDKQEKCKYWSYNEQKQPVKFRQWLHGTVVKDISISYGSNNLPDHLILNRKKYIIYTRFN